jgi:sodium transport system permease protein
VKFLHIVAVVLGKEMRDGVRDRRSVLSVVFSALIGPIMLAFLFTNLASEQRRAEQITLPVNGAQYAPAFMGWLKQQSGVTIVNGPADPEEAVRERKQDVVVIIKKDFNDNLARSVPAAVQVVSDDTRNSARAKVRRVRNLIYEYSSQIGSLRLIARGVSPVVPQAIRVEDIEASSAQQRAATILNVLPMFLVIAALVGGLQVAIDSTAGERERGSLESLLLNPVPRAALITGKWLAASFFGWVSVLFSTALCIVVFRRVPWHDLGVRFNVGVPELTAMLILVLPLTFLLSAMVMLAAMFARSFKEAQSSMGILMLFPVAPSVLSSVYPLSNRPWLAPVPIVGQYALAADILGEKPVAAYFFLIAGAATMALAIFFIVLTSRLLKREAIIFGK